MNHEAPVGQPLSSRKVAAIVVAIILALAAAVLVGIQFGQSLPVGTTSRAAASSPAPALTSATPTFESAPLESPEPTPITTSAAPSAPPPTFDAQVTQLPAPVETFTQEQPPPIAPPPVADTLEELPAAPASPAPEPTCPADNGVTVTIVDAELLREGGVFDEYKLTLVLDNRISVPLNFSVIDSLTFTSVRENGAEMRSGFISLPETYEVPPGRTTFTTEANDPATIYHGFGSPVTAFKLSGEVWVANGTSDQNSRSLYCEFNDIAFGKPLQGQGTFEGERFAVALPRIGELSAHSSV